MKLLFTLLFLIINVYCNANVKLPLLFNDGMVLQRNKPIPVWGWADANEKIEIHFNNQIIKTKADKNGKWIVKLNSEKEGGPYEMIIKGKNSITIKNILIGEVWICSGQSNMEFTVNQVMNARQEMSNADFPMIRQFLVERDMSETPKEDFKAAKWEICNNKTVGNFTAVGYFFAKKIYSELKIPIGIIHTSWGGICVESWTSKEALESSSEFKELVSDMPKIDIDSLAKNQMEILTNRIEKIQGLKISSINEASYKDLNYDDTKWPEMSVPQLWENQQLPNLDGTVWMRKSIKISKENASKQALLELAEVDDQDSTYVNGFFVGTTNRYDAKRIYEIPAGIIKEGINVIAVKITDYTGGGGIWGDSADLKLSLQFGEIPLSGKWKFNVVDVKSELSPNIYPSLLYNAMLHPLIPYAFRGVLWYQGEANVNRADQYKKAFPLMIQDWRAKWNQGDFPFYFVQLSSFNEFNGNSNNGSKWAELREAQSQTLNVPYTGMCVTVDIGNAKDIHPTNKQDVGKRLAAIALHNLYNKNIVFNGPTYKSMKIENEKVILTFDNIGSGLKTSDKYGYVKGFEVAGLDKIFHYAKAYVQDNKVIVFCEEVLNPIAVRYGWADDAGDCNLYNKEDFPASPFRTDDWEFITKNVKYTIDL